MMEKFNIQGKQTSFYKYCPVTFGYTLVFLKVNIFGFPGASTSMQSSILSDNICFSSVMKL